MRVRGKWFAIYGWIIPVAALGLWATGQEPAKRAAPRGRLPAYYKDLVSPDQRDEIYAIQGKYNLEIQELEAKIDKLKQARDAEVERVLTPAQQERLKLLIASKNKGEKADKVNGGAAANDKNADDKKPSDKDVFPK
jgi:hypothetical protein